MCEIADQPESRTNGRPAVTLRALQLVLGLETLGMLAVTGLLAVELATVEPASRTSSLALGVLVLVGLVLLVLLLRGALRRRAWVRGAALTWQVLQAAAGWVTVQGDLAVWAGWAALGASAVGAVCALHPATRATLLERRPSG